MGRDREFGRLEAAAGHRELTLVAGEAGVGKSRLASEALRLAEERGWHRMVGYCTPDAGIPYAPFVTAIRRRTRTMSAPELEELFDGPSLLASALLPEAARAVGLPESSVKEEDLFAGVWQLLSRLSAPSGAILLLEDLHWADTESLRLLSYLARESADLDVWIVATYRSDELHRRHPLTAVLADLSRERRYREVRLEPLAREDLRQMVSAILDDTEVGEEFLDAVLERTEGNPFFVEELIKVLVERGDIFRDRGDWARRDLADIEMPDTVRESLLARTRTLSDAARTTLETAALAGDRLELDVVALATGLDKSVVDDAVSAGLRLQLLVERREGPLSFYAFRHALTREALADELVGPDRQRSHLRIADAMRKLHDEDLDAVAAELADHYAEAADTRQAVEFAIRAARFACTSYAWDEAGRRYDDALRLMERDSAQRLALLLEAAEAIVDGPDPKLVTALTTEAAELARGKGDPLSEGRALNTLQRKLWESGDTPGAVAMSRRAWELVRGRDDKLEARVVARLIRALALAGEGTEARALMPAAIELADRTGHFYALSTIHGSALMLSSWGAEFDAAYDAALDAARRGNEVMAESNLAVNAGYVSLWCGGFDRARGHLQRGMELEERYAPSTRYAAAGYAWLLSLTGEYDEAWGLARSLLDLAYVPSSMVGLSALCEVAERRGDADTGSLVDELWAKAARTGEAQRTVPALAARARYAIDNDGVDAALPLFWEVLEATSAGRTSQGSHWMFSPDLARALFDEDESAELDRWVTAIHEQTARDPQPHNSVADELCGAYLAAATGDGEAPARFEAAASRYAAMPCPARQAEALIGLANHLWRIDRPTPSAESAARALSITETIGAHALSARAQRALARAEEPPLLATVLFTDIVGSTERLAAVGDRAWQSVLDRHNTLVRRELAQWRGHEVNTTGDGFLAWFDRPAQGIRCALALRQTLDAVGITIRAGLHTGECQMSGEDLRGIAVHIAARVSALAGSGEVLVSRTVRDLVAGSDFHFTDHGVQSLKGVEGDWQLFAVSS